MMGLQAPRDAHTNTDGAIIMMEEDTERKSAKLFRPIVSLQRVWKTYVKGGDDIQPSGSLSSLSSDGDSALSSYIPSISFTPVDSGQDPDSEDDMMNTRSSGSPTGRITPKLESHLLPASGHLGVDSENESVVSDYSEMADPVKEHLANVHIVRCPDLNSSSPTRFVVYEKGRLRGRGEGEEEFVRRLRKTNFLSLAQEFADLKRCNEDALPFNLHERRYRDLEESGSEMEEISGDSCGLVDVSFSRDQSEGDCDSGCQDYEALGQPAESQDSGYCFGGKSEVERPTLVDANRSIGFNPSDVTNFDEIRCCGSEETCSDTLSVPTSEGTGKSMQTFSVEKVPDAVPDQPSILPHGRLDSVDLSLCAGEAGTSSERRTCSSIVFQKLKMVEELDDCSIEKVFPQWDWKRLEDELMRTSEMEREKNLQPGSRGDREEILQRLAMLDEEDEWYSRRENELSRTANPLNMDICYVNEAADDQDPDPDDWDSYDDDSRPNVVPFDRSSEAVDELNVHSSTDDLLAKQATLEAEARMALAQVRPTIAQLQSKSGGQKQERLMTKMTGSSPSSEEKISRQIGQRTFERMTFTQLQIFANDLHSQIEVLNDVLMLNLVERDELHMIQDSMLVDIEDLTGRAREYAAKVDRSREEKLLVQKRA